MINPLDIIRKYYTLDSLAGQSLLIHSQLVRDKAQSLAIPVIVLYLEQVGYV